MSGSGLLSTPAPVAGRSKSVSAGETPLKQNMSSTNVFINGPLEEQRKAVREDLGPLPEVTVEFMLEHIIPDSNVDVPETMKKLIEQGIWSDTYGWEAFEGLSPKKLAKRKITPDSTITDKMNTETHIFRKLKLVYDSIISYTQFRNGEERALTLYFDQLPDSSPISETNVRSRPDCCGVLRKNVKIHSSHENKPSTASSKCDPDHKPTGESNKRTCASKDAKTDEPRWLDVACVEEYKIDDRIEDLNDDVFKLIWSLHHIMHYDHRRRFTFGITVENENVRIWFACRQIVIVTRPFNFRTNASQLVELIASLAYATPTQLGYDPTMTLKWRCDAWNYEIEHTTQRPDGSHRKVLYRTIKVLCNTAYNIRGRATRVYLAETAKDENDIFLDRHVVLKDSWIDSARPKEGDTLSTLLEGASTEERELFLTVFQHGVVQIDGRDDSTQDLILKGQSIDIPDDRNQSPPGDMHPLAKRKLMALGLLNLPEHEPEVAEKMAPAHEVGIFYLYNYGPTKSTTSQASNTGLGATSQRTADALSHNTYQKRPNPIVYSPKVHYRIVFEEVGKSVMEIAGSGLATTRLVIQFLRDITMALKYMATKGYVHRDVSAGNIIVINNRAKLSDLEFAKKYGAGATSYVRTGTYSFMAGEVMKGTHSVAKYADRNASVQFVHNPIHDLESLWWVGVWCCMWHYPVPYTAINPSPSKSRDIGSGSGYRTEYMYREFDDRELNHMKAVRRHAETLFPSFDDGFDRLRMEEIHHPTSYLSRQHSGYPIIVQKVTYCLENIRECISWAYSKTQRDLPRTEASYFVDVLRIGNPSVPGTDDLGNKDIPVHDRIVELVRALEEEGGIGDSIFWPLDALEHHGQWLNSQKAKMKLRPRKHLTHCGITNMDIHANYRDY